MEGGWHGGPSVSKYAMFCVVEGGRHGGPHEYKGNVRRTFKSMLVALHPTRTHSVR